MPTGRRVDNYEVRFVLDQHAELDFRSASSLKQQSAGRNVTSFGHIISYLRVDLWHFTPQVQKRHDYVIKRTRKSIKNQFLFSNRG
jgi:hypothetical protein